MGNGGLCRAVGIYPDLVFLMNVSDFVQAALITYDFAYRLAIHGTIIKFC